VETDVQRVQPAIRPPRLRLRPWQRIEKDAARKVAGNVLLQRGRAIEEHRITPTRLYCLLADRRSRSVQGDRFRREVARNALRCPGATVGAADSTRSSEWRRANRGARR